ncbi:MAG: hypothetical protein JZU49_00190 [Sulfuricurvum sp.]|nr:hypothetical protein [Sulfuricurvum sp.]
MKQHFIQVQRYQTKNKAHEKAQQFVWSYDNCLIDDVKLEELITSIQNRIEEINIAFPRCQDIHLSVTSFTDGHRSASIEGNFHMSIVEVKRFELSHAS